jgi:hypothetical protein
MVHDHIAMNHKINPPSTIFWGGFIANVCFYVNKLLGFTLDYLVLISAAGPTLGKGRPCNGLIGCCTNSSFK